MTETTIDKLAAELQNALKDKGEILATAESCTGGWIAKLMTDLAGSSVSYDRGFVTYSNDAKQEMLGVSPATLETFGAVSEETVIAMAEGALENSLATVSISVSGIAGPTGGTKEKPVGTVWFGWAMAGSATETLLIVFEGDRNAVRQQAVATSLRKLIELLRRST